MYHSYIIPGEANTDTNEIHQTNTKFVEDYIQNLHLLQSVKKELNLVFRVFKLLLKAFTCCNATSLVQNIATRMQYATLPKHQVVPPTNVIFARRVEIMGGYGEVGFCVLGPASFGKPKTSLRKEKTSSTYVRMYHVLVQVFREKVIPVRK